MWERLQQKINELKKRDTASVRAYFIIEALKGAGHCEKIAGTDAIDYLHGMGLDNTTIFKMQRRYFANPRETRESLEKSIRESI